MWQGDELVGRSRPPYAATVELRIRRVGSSVLGVDVTGTVTGAVPDQYDGSWANAMRPSTRSDAVGI